MEIEQQGPLMQWIDSNFGLETNAKAKAAINLLSSLMVGVAFTSGIGGDKDLQAHYINLAKAAFGGLYDSGDAENFDEELIAAAYGHLTGENFEDLRNEWAADMDEALAQNRALLGMG